jgi:hypothetical protein
MTPMVTRKTEWAALSLIVAVLLALGPTAAEDAPAPRVTGIRTAHRHGQTFVTWTDAAEGEAGAKYRYSLYRSARPITQENLGQAEP